MFAAACAAPAHHGIAYAGAPAAVGIAHAAAPVAAVHAAPAVAAHVPAPYTTSEVRGAPSTTLHKAPATVRKQLHYGSKDFVSGHTTSILKPQIPDFRIAVPTALKGTHQVNTPLVKTVKEPHVVEERYPVERPVHVPYDVPVYKEQIVEVPRPYNVDKPYAVPVPTPVKGHDFVRHRQTAPIVNHKHTNVHTQSHDVVAPVAVGYAAAPAVATHAVAAPAAVGYAAAPAAVATHAAVAAPAAYAAAPVAAAAIHH